MNMSRIQVLAAVYVVIAILTNLQGGIATAKTEKDWITLGVSSFLAGLIALRAFLDRTSGEQSASDKLASSGQSGAGLPAPTPPLVAAPEVVTAVPAVKLVAESQPPPTPGTHQP